MISQATHAVYQNTLSARQQGQEALYEQALARGRRGQLWSGLRGSSRRLLSPAEVTSAGTVQARTSAGTRTVAIAQICGSESRTTDFDCEFNPLQERSRERWLGIASAMHRGRQLPPVALIQVGDRYFVRDGHHRISVARALGRKAIEATVEVWQVSSGTLEEPYTPATGSPLAVFAGWLKGVRPAEEMVGR